MSENQLIHQLLPLRLPPPPCLFQPRGLPHPPPLFFFFSLLGFPLAGLAAVSFPTFPSALQPSSPKAACHLSVSASVWSLSSIATPWTAARQASLSVTHSRSLLRLVHRVGDAIQPSHPLPSPSPPTINLSQHQGLFQ